MATKTRTPYVVLFAAATVVLAGTTWLAIKFDRVISLHLEHGLLLAINGSTPRLAGVMAIVTLLGSLWAVVVGVIGAYVSGMYRLAWQLALATLTTYALVILMKELIARPRPIGPLDDVYVRAAESGFGFPSGHTAMVTVMAIILLAYVPKKWWAVLLATIPLVALSRLYLGVHAPLDVIGGAALGLAVAAGLRILPAAVRRWLRLA